MNNKIYFILSLFILLLASFQPLEGVSGKKCIALVKKNGKVRLNCGKLLIKKSGPASRFSGLSKRILEKKLMILERKGYTCGPGRIYGYRSSETIERTEGSYKSGNVVSQFYVNPLDEEEIEERGLELYEKPKMRYLCELEKQRDIGSKCGPRSRGKRKC